MKPWILSIGMSVFINAGIAADVPELVTGAEAFNQQECIGRYTSDCVATVCPTSEERDCPEKCQAEAVDKCEEQGQ